MDFYSLLFDVPFDFSTHSSSSSSSPPKKVRLSFQGGMRVEKEGLAESGLGGPIS